MMQGLGVFDPDGRVVLFNQRYVEMMGLPAHFLVGLSLLDLLQHAKKTGNFDGDPEQRFADVVAGIKDGKPLEKILEAVDGRALRVVDQPMANGGWVATIEDITEYRIAERERDRDRNILNLIIDSILTTIAVKDARDRRYVLINRAGEEHFGIPRDKIIGKTARDIWPKATADLISGYEERLLKSDGHLFLEVPGHYTW